MIDKIGVELEGGWLPSRNVTLVRDGSIRDINAANYLIGEIVSRPYKTISTLKEWFLNNYPDTVNESCGLHVHLSFDDLQNYSFLMDKSFNSFFIDEITKWAESNCNENYLWKRIQGRNNYCNTKNWYPEEQSEIVRKFQSDHDFRFAAWNFCYKLHKTAECRVLPMFSDKHIAWSGVITVINIAKKWIEQNKKPISEVIEINEIIEENI